MFITLTFSEEKLEKNKKECKSSDENKIATYAMRMFLERWRAKHKKSLRHWFVTELGHEGTERIHMHGILWGNPALLMHWKYGYWYKGDYVNEKTINYITKYMLKIPEKNPEFIGKVMTSKGLGKGYWKSYNAKRNRYKEDDTNECYKLLS